MLKKIITLVVFSLLCCGMSRAESPVTFLQKTTDKLLVTLKEKRSALKQNPKLVYTIVDQVLIPVVDTKAMSQSVLGPVQWRKISLAERETFSREFTKLVVRTYSSALSAYKDEQVRYYPLRGAKPNQKRVQVHSAIIQEGGRSIAVNYWLIRDDNEWKVYDMSVEGVSLLESFRSQFSSELAQTSFQQFLVNLKQHNKANE